ncbi:MAG: M28 family peptidase [Candidatus Helarchaeota archaeon]|nr:M28 family peptidase [Candidatus Helarchaeota archaeon]
MKNLFKHIEKVAKIPSIYPEEKEVRDFIISVLKSFKREYKVDEIGNLYLLSQNDFKIILSAHMDKQAPPNYKDLGNCIKGKLDDAVGIGIILTLAQEFDFPAFLSIGEEDGLRGSEFALNNNLIPNVESAIVIDTSPFGELGNGPIFYTSFEDKKPSNKFLDEIFNTASSLNVKLHPIPGFINDGVNLIKAIPDTVALEPHIDNNHTTEEIASKKDIIDVFKIIQQYFKLKKI